MRVKNKLYPYPILKSETGDYKSTRFLPDIKAGISQNECKLVTDFNCSNTEICALVEEGKAKYAVHLECKYTYYRKIFFSSKPHFEVSIKSDEVDRIIEVCPLIVTSEDIDNYSNTDLDEVYEGEFISFTKGNPLAVGEQITITITKERDTLKKLSSPFVVRPYPGTAEMPDQKHMTLEYSGDLIVIYLSKRDFAILKNSEEPKNMNTIHAALYFPAVMSVLEYMQTDDSDAYADRKWYLSINAKAKEMGIDIKSPSNIPLDMSQRIFGYPITRWLEDLGNGATNERNDS